MLQFSPDAIDIAPELLSAVSAVPTIRGYKNPPAGVSLGIDALAAACQGAVYAVKLDNSVRTIAGTASKLYEVAGTSWTDISRGGNYSIGTALWRYAQSGNTTLAINKSTVLQQSSSGAFADVANAPKAALIESVGNFVMLANTDDTGLGITGGPNADRPNGWWCSQAITSTTGPLSTWAPSASTLATAGLLIETPGPITGLRRLGNDCSAYKDKSVYVGRYMQNSAEVWRWQCLSKDVGCSSHEAIVPVATKHFFVGDSDFYLFDGGSEPIPIGKPIKGWFFERLNRTLIGNIKALHNRSEKLILWFYPVSTGSTLTSCVAYHYDSDRWGAFDLTVEDVVETVSGSMTYATIDTLFATYAAFPSSVSYDSPILSGGTPVIAYFNSSHALQSLSANATTMTMTTGWYGDENVISLCSTVRPRYRTKPTSATLNSSTVMSLGDTATARVTGAALHNGRFDVWQAGRFHNFDLSHTGSTEIEAISPTLTAESDE